MKSLNICELEQICNELNSWKGYQIQSLNLSVNQLYFNFFGKGASHWLLISLRPQTPLAIILSKAPAKKLLKTKKPLLLFLESHARGAYLQSAIHLNKLGRVIEMTLGHADNKCTIEFRLFPHGQNVIVTAGGKSISWKPVSELTQVDEMKGENPSEQKSARSFTEIERQYFSPQKESVSSALQGKEKAWKQHVKKLERAIQKIQIDLKEKKEKKWTSLAQKLQKEQRLDLGNLYEPYIDPSKGLEWNIKNCFERGKKNKLKIKGQEDRLREVELSCEEDKAKGFEHWQPKNKKHKLEFKTDVKHKRALISENCSVIVGRSSRDNLKILRGAKAWDYWMHLKDFPSAHAILQRPKKYTVSEDEYNKAMEFLLKNNFGQKLAEHKGEVFEVLVAESRFVRPIKGDKIGRVNYHNERVFHFKL